MDFPKLKNTLRGFNMNEIDYYYLANMNLNRFPGIKDNDILFFET